jgi:hypothetical protein
MTASIVQIVWLHRRLFIFVMGLTFLALAIATFTIPERATIRSSIEIGSAIIGDKPEPFEPPEQVAKRIPSVYGPAALLAMAKKGTSPLILRELQNPNVESIGRSVVVVSTIAPSAENEAKEFQESIADQIIKELAPRARALREGIAARIVLASKASDNFEQQITADANEIEHIRAFSDDLRGRLENHQADLAALYQRTGAALEPGASNIVEAHIRELNEQILIQITLMGKLALERSHLTRELATTRRLHETQGMAIADVQFERNSFNETYTSLPPSLMPARTTSRRLSLLLVALTISILVAFGTAVLVHNVGREKI